LTTWTDEHGTKLRVLPGIPAKLTIHEEGAADAGVFELDDPGLFTDVSIEILKAAGHPAPVILQRPDIDPAVSADLGPLGVWLAEGGDVVLAFGSRSIAVPLQPAAALTLAALIAAYAEASGSRDPEPDPADVERLASLVTEASRMSPGDAARYLLGKGVRLGDDGDRG
jgi:hypothetical protein